MHLIANNTRFVQCCRALTGHEPRHAGAGMEPAAVVKRHAPVAWASGASGRDLRGPEPLCRVTCYRASMAFVGHDPGLPASARRQRPAGPHTVNPRSFLPSPCNPNATTESTRRRPASGPARANAQPAQRRGCAPCSSAATSQGGQAEGQALPAGHPAWRWR